MPYYIYSITEQPIKLLKKLEQNDGYRDASVRAKQLRTEQLSGTPVVIKMIHAETELHAEDLLNQVREQTPELGDD